MPLIKPSPHPRNRRYAQCAHFLLTDNSFAVDATTPCFGREAEHATLDYLKRYEDVAHLLHRVLPDKSARILMLGCGDSTLLEDVRHALKPSA